MRSLLSLCVILMAAAFVQGQSGGQSAATKGACSPAVTGSNNQFKITCQGIGKEQGEVLLKILNQILTSQLDANAILKQIQENQGWPRLSQEQTKTLRDGLAGFAGQKVHIVVANQDENRFSLAAQLRDSLKSAGWDAGVDTIVTFGPPDAVLPRGIGIQVKNETPAADALLGALFALFGPATVKGMLNQDLSGDFIEIDIHYKPK